MVQDFPSLVFFTNKERLSAGVFSPPEFKFGHSAFVGVFHQQRMAGGWCGLFSNTVPAGFSVVFFVALFAK